MVILSDSNEYMKGESRQIIPPAVSYITFLGGGASTLHIKRQHQSHKANVSFLKTVINTLLGAPGWELSLGQFDQGKARYHIDTV